MEPDLTLKQKKDISRILKKVEIQLDELKNNVEKEKRTIARFSGVVKKWGGSGHIPTLKKYRRHRVEVIIYEEKEKEDEVISDEKG